MKIENFPIDLTSVSNERQVAKGNVANMVGKIVPCYSLPELWTEPVIGKMVLSSGNNVQARASVDEADDL